MLRRTVDKIPKVLHNYIGGTSLPACGTPLTSFNVPNPATGNHITNFSISGLNDVNKAVETAKVGQAQWKNTAPAERAYVMREAARILRSRVTDLADLECLDTGRPRKEMDYDIACAWECLEYMSSICQTTASTGEHVLLNGASPDASFGYTRREPLGVCAGIGAWNCKFFFGVVFLVLADPAPSYEHICILVPSKV